MSLSAYRPDVDGLRALAIIAVVLFHVGLGLPGGFVGVDIFFVISGYLITGILKRDFEDEHFQLRKFWERRIRRILPASVVTIVVTLAVAYFIMLSDDFKSVAQSAIAQTFFGANIYFWQTIDYFTDQAGALPLLHTWSLAVEEQFYLVFPLVMLFFRKTTGRSDSRALYITLAVVAGLSFAASAVGVLVRPQFTFYWLPTRAWELMIGSLLALAGNRLVPTRPMLRELLSWLGAVLLIVPLFVYSDATPFPGLAALAPCLGAALVIASNAPREGTTLTTFGRLLALKPVVFVGLISYSLYLLHWPVLVLFQYQLGPMTSVWAKLALVAAVVILAWLSWLLVETPVRRKQLFTTNKAAFIFAAVALVVVSGAGAVAWKMLPNRFADEEKLVFAYTHQSKFRTFDITPQAVDADQGRAFGIDSPGIDLVLWGDSHARMILPALDQVARQQGLSGMAIAYSGTRPLVEYQTNASDSLAEETPEWAEAVLRFVARHKVPDVVMAARWQKTQKELGSEKFQWYMRRTVDRLEAAGARVWLVLDSPDYSPISVPRKLLSDLIRHSNPEAWAMTPAEYNNLNKPILEFMAKNTDPNLRFLDPRPYLLNPDQLHYAVSDGWISLYRDAHHLTSPAVEKRYVPMFEQQFQLR